MPAFEESQKAQRKVQAFEARVLKAGMLVPLFFWAWITYHSLQSALQGLRLLFP